MQQTKNLKKKRYSILITILTLTIGVLFFIPLFIFLPKVLTSHYVVNKEVSASPNVPVESVFVPSYVETPAQVKGIYMTSWVAGTPSLREKLVKLIDDTELNSLVIDIKDYSGKIVFEVSDPKLKSFGSEEIRVSDMRDFIEMLHQKNIYVIGRVAVFQDAYFVKHRPDLAVKNGIGNAVWKDRKGISWIDAGSQEYWDYIVLIAKEARKIGFDEINFDYIRFPSDGNMHDISFPWSSTTPKSLVLRNFFEYIDAELEATLLVTSADLFGMVTTAKDDMGIGQILENALPYFDYIMPMVYPSHYPATFNGYKNPAEHPYEVVNFAMKSAVDRAVFASTSPLKLRPWLQDFDLGANYGAVEVRAQVKATYDVGLSSWILWSASNSYTKDALDKALENNL